MTNEPVAYRVDGTIYNNINDAEFAVREIKHLRKALGIDNGLIPKPVYIEQLYTAEQLHPRVKMTQAEFDEWKEIFNDFEFFSDAMSQGVTVEKHVKLFTKIYLTKHNDLSSLEIEVKFARLWANFNPDNPEETIEIVPEKKWFVRSKEPNGNYWSWFTNWGYLISNEKNKHPNGSIKFDTKEQAEEWTNQLTEAVLLPVEDE